MEKIKVGVIGAGSISQEHIRSYLNKPGVELYALCDINEKTLKNAGEKYGVTRLFTDKDKMLAALPELDAVSVCTWNSAHAPCAIAALDVYKRQSLYCIFSVFTSPNFIFLTGWKNIFQRMERETRRPPRAGNRQGRAQGAGRGY